MTLALVGCAGRPTGQPELATVTGTVTMDGQPLADKSVVFESDRGVLSFGNTDTKGRYKLSYIRSAKGAGLGKNVVRISTPTMGPTGPLHKDSIPAIYNTASILEAEVVKGRNVFDFALESKQSGKWQVWLYMINRSSTNWGDDWSNSSPHAGGGINASMCDGSVRWISENIAMTTYARIRSKAEGTTAADY